VASGSAAIGARGADERVTVRAVRNFLERLWHDELLQAG
jgi:hypothetical protein